MQTYFIIRLQITKLKEWVFISRGISTYTFKEMEFYINSIKSNEHNGHQVITRRGIYMFVGFGQLVL